MGFLALGGYDTAGDSPARGSGGLAHQVVCLLVQDHASADDGLGARANGEEVRGALQYAATVGADHDVAEVSTVTLGSVRSTVDAVRGVEMTACGSKVRGAAITGLVNVKTMLTTSSGTLNLGPHGHCVADLREGNATGYAAALAALEVRAGYESHGRRGGRGSGGRSRGRLMGGFFGAARG